MAIYWPTVHTNSGGIVIECGYCAASNQSRGTFDLDVLSKLPLTLDINGENPINLTLVATSVNASTLTFGFFNWRELK